MFVKNNQHLFQTDVCHLYETLNRIKFEEIMHRTSKFYKRPYCSCVTVFKRILNSIKSLPTKSFKKQSLNQFYGDPDISSSSNRYDKLQKQ